MSIPSWKTDLISTSLNSNILTFGSFTLKSGRVSPYFVNCGLFSKFKDIHALNTAYANTIHAYAQSHPEFEFDVIFGPAYKGIQLSAATGLCLYEIDREKYGNAGSAYNRKEKKDHGEGGLVVGSGMKGKKVLIIDDVITAGTAIREAIDIIEKEGGKLVGIVVAIDRQEKMPSASEKEGKGDDGTERGSAIGEVRRETGVPVLAVLTLGDMIEGLRGMGKGEEVKGMEEYRRVYGARD